MAPIRSDVLRGALLQPAGGVGLVVFGTVLRSHGPEAFSHLPTSLFVWALQVGGVLLVLSSVLFGFGGSFVFGVAAFFVLMYAAGALPQAVERYALQQRGLVTDCVVEELNRRVENYTGREGQTRSEVYHDHTLGCTDPEVAEMTTRGGPAGQVGERILVAFDPSGRLDPRPAGSAGNYPTKLLTGGAALVGGLALNLAGWLGVGARFFEALLERYFSPLLGRAFAAVDWWRDRWQRVRPRR